MKITLMVNGKTADVQVDDPNMPLLYALRNDLALRGPRFGCGLAQCGACTVHIDGKAMRSCVYPVGSVGKSKVTTLEGLAARRIRIRCSRLSSTSRRSSAAIASTA